VTSQWIRIKIPYQGPGVRSALKFIVNCETFAERALRCRRTSAVITIRVTLVTPFQRSLGSDGDMISRIMTRRTFTDATWIFSEMSAVTTAQVGTWPVACDAFGMTRSTSLQTIELHTLPQSRLNGQTCVIYSAEGSTCRDSNDASTGQSERLFRSINFSLN
jgi:hypothetical protein